VDAATSKPKVHGATSQTTLANADAKPNTPFRRIATEASIANGTTTVVFALADARSSTLQVLASMASCANGMLRELQNQSAKSIARTATLTLELATLI